MKVLPITASGYNMSILGGLLGLGPTWSITCGNCEVTFRERLPLVDRPGIQCPACSAINIINVVVA